jgi:hypothetical protein
MPDLKVVYCLTSSGGDLYEAMTRVSLATVRLTNPTARIEIACDQQTHQALQATGSQLLREADALHGFPTPDGPPTFRNRFVKTQLGRLIDGPFLFLDSDTVVRKPLTSLLDLHCDIAAASNNSAETLAEQIWSEDQANLDTMGWQVREPYVNGGVIWYADSPGVRRFVEAWHRNWHDNVERTGRYRDQPALNQALSADLEIQFHTLPHCWNAQLLMRPEISEDSLVWHLYSSVGLSEQDYFSFCCQLVLEGRSRRLPSRSIQGLVNARTPKRAPSFATQLRSSLRSKLQTLLKAG